MLTLPPGTASPVSTLTQEPPGIVTAVSPHAARPCPSRATSRGTTTTSPPVRVKATACPARDPAAGRAW